MRMLCLVHSRGLVLLSLLVAHSVQAPAGPGIDDLLNLKRVGSPAISPDGRNVAYTLRETNCDDNEFETEIWVGGGDTEPRQITNGRKSSQQPKYLWSAATITS